MRTFFLNRVVDESGVSGVGKIAQGVEFDTGMVAMAWLTEISSVAIYPDIQSVVKIHGHGGKTRLVFDRSEQNITVVAAGAEIDPELVVATVKRQLSEALVGDGELFDPDSPPDSKPPSPFLGDE